MNLPFAQRCAERLVSWLAPHCVRIEVAGSVRRRKADPADLDLVVIPKVIQEQDLFGTTTARRNAAWIEIDRRVSAEKWEVRAAGAQIVTFVAGGVQVDVFWASEATWGTTLLQRTGSKEHNIWLCRYAEAQGGRWHVSSGLYLGHKLYAQSEEEIYRALGLNWMPPEEREAARLPFAGLIRAPGVNAVIRRG